MRNKQKNSKGKIVVAVALAGILLIGGTVAWLTSRSELENKFTVGAINPIDPTDPTDPGPGDKGPIDPEDPNLGNKLNGNLYEPSWVYGSKLMPGIEIAKDPYVGVGKKSEECYVYVYVESTMPKDKGNDVYFTLNEGWAPVKAEKGNNEGEYISGLFKYNAGLNGSASEGNTWTTTPLFSQVKINEKADKEDFVTTSVDGKEQIGSIKVQSFLHQMKDSHGTPINENTVVYPALEQAFGITLP